MVKTSTHRVIRPRDNNKYLKDKAAAAKMKLRTAKHLQKRIADGNARLTDFTLSDQLLIEELSRGVLQKHANEAIAAFGHGTICDETGREIHLGGSTGGVTRLLLDDYQAPGEADIGSS